ncbi:MAG: NAD(P)H-hydrate dehydratase, partial [Sulfolobaceae archaeon]
REPLRSIIRIINQSKGFKISIDVPSGVDADTGEVYNDDYVKPDLVITLHDIKPGLLKHNFPVVIKKIGIPKEAEIYVGPGDVIYNIRKRPITAKKGDFGRLLVIGGSYTYSGAPALASLAALRTGVDLVYTAAPEDTAKIIASYSPALITIKTRGRYFTEENIEEIKPWISKVDAILIGPGMGLEEGTIRFVRSIIDYIISLEKPVVIDADALKAIKGSRLYKKAVLTPHAGEFYIYTGEKVPEDPKERINIVVRKAKEYNTIIVLKGYFDVISNGEEFKLNKTGNPAMTVGGTGDTLSGIIAALISQKIEPYIAAYLGCFINGLAGSLAYQEKGERLLPTDVIEKIPLVLKDPMDAFKKKVYKRVM